MSFDEMRETAITIPDEARVSKGSSQNTAAGKVAPTRNIEYSIADEFRIPLSEKAREELQKQFKRFDPYPVDKAND